MKLNRGNGASAAHSTCVSAQTAAIAKGVCFCLLKIGRGIKIKYLVSGRHFTPDVFL